MSNTDIIFKALDLSEARVKLATDYSNSVTKAWAYIQEVMADQGYDVISRNTVRRACGNRMAARAYQQVTRFLRPVGVGSPADPLELSTDYLYRESLKWADAMIEDVATKLAAKLGDEADIVEATRMRADGSFTVYAIRDGHRVKVIQSRVFKVSNKGTPFYQWPAHIYVDDQFVTEKAYKIAFQSEEAVKAALQGRA